MSYVGIISVLHFTGDPEVLVKRVFDLGESVAREVTEAAAKGNITHQFEYVLGETQQALEENLNNQIAAFVVRRGLNPSDFHFKYKYEEIVNNLFNLPYGKESSAKALFPIDKGE